MSTTQEALETSTFFEDTTKKDRHVNGQERKAHLVEGEYLGHITNARSIVRPVLGKYQARIYNFDVIVADENRTLKFLYEDITGEHIDITGEQFVGKKLIDKGVFNFLDPQKDDTFVKFGPFTDLKKIVSSKLFYPAFITGLSGNGKTFGVEQVCAQLGRELIRVNITIETDEDDLIGGFRLVNGETVWHNGPVIEALERGAILLLDEIDLASNKILCLQSILEGTGVFLKKVGRFIRPAAGFNVIATANTKGKGSDDGRFIGTNVLNEAFLERFPVTFEQSYPKPNVEIKILEKIAATLGVKDADFCKRLVDWGDIIRKTFYDGGIEEIVSTRRLVHIIRAYSIFNDKAKAIQVCINRFDDETKQSFLELYDKVDADFELPVDEAPQS